MHVHLPMKFSCARKHVPRSPESQGSACCFKRQLPAGETPLPRTSLGGVWERPTQEGLQWGPHPDTRRLWGRWFVNRISRNSGADDSRIFQLCIIYTQSLNIQFFVYLIHSSPLCTQAERDYVPSVSPLCIRIPWVLHLL